jgi:hypothetical protein
MSLPRILRALLATALSLGLAAPASAALLDGGLHAQAPVTPGSPAWTELMALPLRDHDALALPAADVLQAWKRPEDAGRLRRAMLLAQLRIATGAQPLPPEDARLGSLWSPAAPLPSVDALHDAWAAALQRGLEVAPAPQPPDAGAIEPRAVPGLPGWWRVDEAGHTRVLMTVTNRAPVRLAPGRSAVRVSWSGTTREVALRCVLQVPEQGLAPGRSGPLSCVADAVPAGVARPPDAWAWEPPALVTDDDLAALARLLAWPASTAGASLAARAADCVSQGNCSDAQHDAVREQAAAREEARRARDAAAAAERDAATLGEMRRTRWRRLGVLAGLVAGQFVFIRMARLTGSLWPATAVIMAASTGVSFWLAQAAREAGHESLAPLVLGMLAVAALGAGALLCAVYAAVYRGFFADE